ncbi:hypothetical protein ACH42_07235 [Endozoicomonas sp. (ex Bugula neritina AB1)]|nr:hypothetical protein ACH42_07235 [Endozoicomonas sp. (ex Bugula neritina AB1)]
MDNQKRAEAYHKSRLGRILVNKGYISQTQLDAVVAEYEGQNKLLGEILVSERLISRWQLRRALSSQTKLRLAASLSVALLSPVQMIIADDQHTDTKKPVAALVEPLLNSGYIGSDSTEIQYKPEQARAEIKTNGSIRLRLPSSIGELRFDHLRLKISPDDGYEALDIDDIDLTDAVLSVRSIY